MTKELEAISFQIGFGAVQNFGINLYTTNPPAIAELVANGWDAYARNVDVIVNDESTKPSLTIVDDGHGMNYDVLKNRYAISGVPKPDDEIQKVPEGFKKRPIMGRKGIGKFAAFSLGSEYYIYTKTKGADKWICLKLNYEEMVKDGYKPAILVPPIMKTDHEVQSTLPIEGELPVSGTIVYIPRLRHKIITTSIENLRKLISRRFSVNVFNIHQFNLRINGENQDLKKQFYDSEIQFLHFFGYEETEVEKRFPSANRIKDISNDYTKQNGIKGWIGTALKPTDLKIERQGDAAGIIVYINGKLADENVLRMRQNQNMGAAYIVGEVQSDFLQTSEIDPITSSREGLNQSLEQVQSFIAEIAGFRNDLVTAWKTYRSEDKKTDWREELHSITFFEDFYNKQSSSTKKKVDKIASDLLEGKESSKAEIFYPIIMSFAVAEKVDSTSLPKDVDESVSLETIKDLFNDLHLDEALRATATIRNRLEVINKLKDEVNENVIETTLERVLADHPWLLNPFWDAAPVKEQKKFKYRLPTGQVQDGRSDILVYTAENEFHGFPVIVELKRSQGSGHPEPDVMEILSQITKYRKGLIAESQEDPNYMDTVNAGDILGYFLAGDRAISKLSRSDRDILKNNNIKVNTFNNLIKKASNLYDGTITEVEDM